MPSNKTCAYHLSTSLKEDDPELNALIEGEEIRQRNELNLIASENFASSSVLECLGSRLTNKYSEGTPGKRYYGGNVVIDEIELLCQRRALNTFGLKEQDWGVNVQPYSGSPANFAVFIGLLNPHDRIMGLDLPDGGHLTHGYMNKSRRVSATSMFWESMPYHVNSATGLIDYEALAKSAQDFRPRLIIAGFSSYPRHLDYARFRLIADSVGAILMSDMSHVAGLVASGLSPSPFEHCHVVTTTTHKTLRGPRSGLIFSRKDAGPSHGDLCTKINLAVFPGLQGGPHNNVIAAVATALLQVQSKEFREYARAVLQNSKVLERRFHELGYTMSTSGTDNHLLLVDVSHLDIDGGIAEKALEAAGISVNKNCCPGDTSVFRPSGIRVGTPALTSRSFGEPEFKAVADLVNECLVCAAGVVKATGGDKMMTMATFEATLKHESVMAPFIAIRQRVADLASAFPLP